MLRYTGIERYINEVLHRFRLAIKGFIQERLIYQRSFSLLRYGLEILVTGFLIHYSITNFNFVSVGLISALATYYIKWFVKLVKRKEIED